MGYFKIRNLSSNGGFGEVFLCKDEFENKYALKELKKRNKDSIRRFQREVRLIDKMDHPNVLKLVFFHVSEAPYFYVMPLYKCDLIQVIPNLYEDYYRQSQIISAILNGVQYLHSEGIIHRDLKPGNILYNSDSDLVISDLGLGVEENSETTILTKSTRIGTEKYTAPEQWENLHSVDERADIFSLGKIIEDIVSDFGKKNYNPIFGTIIDKCTRNSPEDRFESVSELKKYVSQVYAILLDNVEEKKTEDKLLEVTNDTISNADLLKLASSLIESGNLDNVEKFFVNITGTKYDKFESTNDALAKKMVSSLIQYWDQPNWPFSYIDTIANTSSKLFIYSEDVTIRANLLYNLTKLSIEYNRWYAMKKVKVMLQDLETDLSLKADFCHMLNANPLKLDIIFGGKDNLPMSIKKINSIQTKYF
ncbi:serine/threonine-protein kinase [Lactobacillus porci]|uniref:non-specific serine/threonine protein kinase n=1 Tax=Lactobacillus porci TaxID=2012477 RepID=A0A6A8MF88_9LACO|nr:serine/threonine-protein kinase [Lactobacillus porci]MST87435.1 serine/threonine protein kinase [Lactobacillus porci]